MIYSLPQVACTRTPLAPQRRTSLGNMMNQGNILLMSAIGGLILALAMLILFHQNANATKGYNLRTLERQRSQLLLEQQLLNMQLAAEQSLETLETSHKIQAMLPSRARDVEYMRDFAAVAKKAD